MIVSKWKLKNNKVQTHQFLIVLVNGLLSTSSAANSGKDEDGDDLSFHIHFACFLLRNYIKRHEKAPGATRKSGAKGATLKLVLEIQRIFGSV